MPVALTYEAIATTTPSNGATSIQFNSIPSTFTDLLIVAGGYSSADISYNLEFNGDTGSNYSTTYLLGSGSASSSGRLTNDVKIVANGRTGTSGGIVKINIGNYSNTNMYKTTLAGGVNTSGYVAYSGGSWRSNSAINSIKITPESGTISSGSVWTIYGIKAA